MFQIYDISGIKLQSLSYPCAYGRKHLLSLTQIKISNKILVTNIPPKIIQKIKNKNTFHNKQKLETLPRSHLQESFLKKLNQIANINATFK